jgi:cytochrome c553
MRAGAEKAGRFLPSGRIPVRLAIMLLATVAGAGAADPTALAEAVGASYEREIRPLLERYCYDCHGQDTRKGEVDFAQLASRTVALGQRALWKRAALQLTSRHMPPPARKNQPSDAERSRIIAWIAALRRSDRPDPGRVTSRRLNRAEYDATIRDLLGIAWRPAEDFPADDAGEGFDNLGEVLSLSPLLMEKYLLAADSILDRVVIDDRVDLHWSGSELAVIADGKLVERAAATTAASEGAAPKALAEPCLLTGPGEAFATLSIPSEATYTLRFKAAAQAAGNEAVRVAVKIDGQVVYECKVSAPARSPAAHAFTTVLSPGQKRLSLVFLNPFTEPAFTADVQPAAGAANRPAPPAKRTAGAPPRTRGLLLESLEVVGPPAAPASEAHRRLFIAAPGPGLPRREAARRIAQAFAARAYRHPPTEAQLDLLLRVFDLADGQDALFSDAVKLMLKAVLISPRFLFRIEEDRPADADGAYALGDHDLASRLSYFLWSSMPDEQLFARAADGTLHQPEVLVAQVRRMLLDAKARALVDNFAGQWLQLRNIFVVAPDRAKFPELGKDLRQAMYDEAALLFEDILRGNRSLMELIDCDYTYVNAELAKHYGITGVSGRQMRRVRLEDHDRGGILTLGGLLTVTANPTRTSPVKRGKWVLQEILGAPPPPPPPMVESLDRQDDVTGATLSLRQKMERHRADPACASCHEVMDQIGFGLEGFDAIGRARTRDDGGMLIDSSGQLPGNRRFGSPAELKRLLLGQADDFARTFTARLLTYALGRRLQDADDAAIEGIVRATAKDGHRLGDLVVAIATSYPFLNRRISR